jgi:nucleotide-binding universal stress UspA family protein
MPGSALHTIIMPVRDDGKGEAVLAHAAIMAQRFGAHVRIIHCHPRPDDMMPYGVVVPRFLRRQIEEAAQRNATSDEVQLRQRFRAQAEALGLAEDGAGRDGPTCSFVEYEGKQVDAVRHYGRLADLICVPQPDKASNLGFNTLKSALFSSGRPVMLCPEREVPPAIGRHVAIGWNGSLEAARAVAMAMPLIETAERVTILSKGHSEHAATAEELAEYLARREVVATPHAFEVKGNAGRALLDKCGEFGADLLVMGAYHESYERETVFGGNSQAVVDEATLPVVMVH